MEDERIISPEKAEITAANETQKKPETPREILESLLGSVDVNEAMVQEILEKGKTHFETLLDEAMQFGVSDTDRDRYFAAFSALQQRLAQELEAYKKNIDDVYENLDAIDDPWSSEASRMHDDLAQISSRKNQLGGVHRKLDIAVNTLEVLDDEVDGTDPVERCLGIDTDELFAEKAQLEQRVAFYAPIMEELLASNSEVLDEKDISHIFSRVVDRLRSETDIMDKYDEEGVDVFVEDLRVQPNFPKIDSIVFTANPYDLPKDKKDILRKAKTVEDIRELIENDGLVCTDEIDLRYLKSKMNKKFGGSYATVNIPQSKRVYMHRQPLSLGERQKTFLLNGGLDDTTSGLVHEIRHHQQDLAGFPSNTLDRANVVLREAQSFVEFPLSSKVESIREIVGVVTEKPGSYQFNVDMAISAMEAVERLNAMGLSQSEIADVLSRVDVKTTSSYETLDILVKQEMKKRDLGEGDVDVLRDVFRVNRKVDKMRVQRVAQEEVVSFLGEDSINELIQQRKDTIVPYEHVNEGSEPVPALLISNNVNSSLRERRGVGLFLDEASGEVVGSEVVTTYDEAGTVLEMNTQQVALVDDQHVRAFFKEVGEEDLIVAIESLLNGPRLYDDVWADKSCSLEDGLMKLKNDVC